MLSGAQARGHRGRGGGLRGQHGGDRDDGLLLVGIPFISIKALSVSASVVIAVAVSVKRSARPRGASRASWS